MALPARDAGEMGGPQAASEPARFGTRWAETEEVVCPLAARPHHTALYPLATGPSHMAPCTQRHFPASRVEWVSRDGVHVWKCPLEPATSVTTCRTSCTGMPCFKGYFCSCQGVVSAWCGTPIATDTTKFK